MPVNQWLGVMNTFQKIAKLKNNIEEPFSHAAVYSSETLSSGVKRVVAGAPNGEYRTFAELTFVLTAPYFLLYVLHTPRGEGDPGRYQSPALTGIEVSNFLVEFSDFLGRDARFDIWSHSPNSGGTVVWERHNMIYAYGPLNDYEKILINLGYETGKTDANFPHCHYYRAEYDVTAKYLLNYMEWSKAPLQPEDEQ